MRQSVQTIHGWGRRGTDREGCEKGALCFSTHPDQSAPSVSDKCDSSLFPVFDTTKRRSAGEMTTGRRRRRGPGQRGRSGCWVDGERTEGWLSEKEMGGRDGDRGEGETRKGERDKEGGTIDRGRTNAGSWETGKRQNVPHVFVVIPKPIKLIYTDW